MTQVSGDLQLRSRSLPGENPTAHTTLSIGLSYLQALSAGNRQVLAGEMVKVTQRALGLPGAQVKVHRSVCAHKFHDMYQIHPSQSKNSLPFKGLCVYPGQTWASQWNPSGIEGKVSQCQGDHLEGTSVA